MPSNGERLCCDNVFLMHMASWVSSPQSPCIERQKKGSRDWKMMKDAQGRKIKRSTRSICSFSQKSKMFLEALYLILLHTKIGYMSLVRAVLPRHQYVGIGGI